MIKTKKLVLLFAGILSAQLSMQTFAACSLSSGWYGDGDIGYTRAVGKSYPNSTSNKSSGQGWSFAIGYKFTRYVALEAGYTRYMATRIRNSQGITAARDNHYSADVTSKLILPIMATGLEFFGKLGIMQITSHIGSINPAAAAVNNMTFNTGNQTSTGLYWGLGAQYYFTPGISAHIQYAQGQGNNKTGSLGLGSIGLSLLF